MSRYLETESQNHLHGCVTKYRIIPAILSADVLLADFFVGLSVSLLYLPETLIHLQAASLQNATPSRLFCFQRPKFSF